MSRCDTTPSTCMTSKAQSLPSGIVKLSRLLEHLNKPPKLTFKSNVKSLRLSLAYQNDHWDARRFVKEELPRIRYANPDLEINVTKWRKEKTDRWRPELEVVFDSGEVKAVDMDSSAILQEVMSIAGGEPWHKHVHHDSPPEGTTGTSPDKKSPPEKSVEGKRLPNLWQFLKENPLKEKKVLEDRKARAEWKAQKGKNKDGKKRESGDTPGPEVISETTAPSPEDSLSTN